MPASIVTQGIPFTSLSQVFRLPMPVPLFSAGTSEYPVAAFTTSAISWLRLFTASEPVGAYQ